MTRARWVGAAGSIIAVSVLATLGMGTPAQAAPAVPAVRAAGLPPPPACASAVAISKGRRPPGPVPLPPPRAALAGVRPARPGLQVTLPVGAARPPALRATAFIVADLSTGNVL